MERLLYILVLYFKPSLLFAEQLKFQLTIIEYTIRSDIEKRERRSFRLNIPTLYITQFLFLFFFFSIIVLVDIQVLYKALKNKKERFLYVSFV